MGVLLALVCLVLGCKGDAVPAGAGVSPRTYRLGFSAIGPRPETAVFLATVQLWSQRGDIALVQTDVPWAALLADTSAGLLVTRDQLPLANLYRGHGFPLVVMVEPENGLARDRESDALAALGRSPPSRPPTSDTCWRWTASSTPSTWAWSSRAT